MISFKNFSFKYNNVVDKTLKNIDLTINKGEKVLIVGPSGSGKSTLSHCINGLIPFSYRGEFEGELKIDDIIPYKESLSEVSKKVGTILQDQDSQFIGLSVGEDVAFSFENNAIPLAEMKVKVINSLELVNMVDFINHSPYEVSGGQKQRTACARALITNPKLILADEPTGALDSRSAQMLIEMISSLNKDFKATILMVTHDSFTASYCDRILFIKDGKIFTELVRGNNTRKQFFNQILDVVALLGGDVRDVR